MLGQQPTLPGRNPDLTDTRGLSCKMADTIDEWSAAFSIVYDRYRTCGLIDPNPYNMRVLPYHLLPSTNTFVAMQNGHVACTATLVTDSSEGLPLEPIFPAEIERKRLEGLTLAEVSCLASRITSAKTFFNIFLPLQRLLSQHARRFGVDQLIVACHPKHARLYERSMGFHQFTHETTYSTLHDAPVVGIALDFAEVDRVRPPCWDAMFKDPLPLADLLPRPMTPEAVEYFAPMVDMLAECVPAFA
ncbi:MAG: hypothetical protein KF861_04520 [Planctomycetaceae bacterium]|nr:hypothetical protein [Planctomycetaceae bacterium]